MEFFYNELLLSYIDHVQLKKNLRTHVLKNAQWRNLSEDSRWLLSNSNDQALTLHQVNTLLPFTSFKNTLDVLAIGKEMLKKTKIGLEHLNDLTKSEQNFREILAETLRSIDNINN